MTNDQNEQPLKPGDTIRAWSYRLKVLEVLPCGTCIGEAFERIGYPYRLSQHQREVITLRPHQFQREENHDQKPVDAL